MLIEYAFRYGLIIYSPKVSKPGTKCGQLIIRGHKTTEVTGTTPSQSGLVAKRSALTKVKLNVEKASF